MQTKTPTKAMPIRRRVRREFTTPDGVTGFVAKSFTRTDKPEVKAPEHHPAIDKQSGEVRCTCEHFQFKLAKQNPDLRRRETWCKHITRAVEGLVRSGELSADILTPVKSDWVIAFAPNKQCFIFTDAANVPANFGMRYDAQSESPESALRALMLGTFNRRLLDVRMVRDTARPDVDVWEAKYREECAVEAPDWMKANLRI